MKPRWANQYVYKYFDAFIEKSILTDDSYITDKPGIFTLDNLDACIKAFVDNPDTSKRDFDTKSKDQFLGTPKEVQEVFAHFIWLWGMPASDMTLSGKKGAVTRFLGNEYNNKLKNVFVKGGIGSAGQRHKIKKPFEIAYLLLLFREVKNHIVVHQINDVQDVKTIVEILCKELYYNNQAKEIITDERLRKAGNEYLAMHHILLHLCFPDKYEAIAAQKHKDAIINTFFSLLDQENTEGLGGDIDTSILAIRNKLSEVLNREVDFYDKDIHRAWNFEESKGDVSEVTLFEYKKALVFYGPPGTSKTHSAKRLAELLISKQYFREKRNLKEYFANAEQIFEAHIHRLQLHSNYNYEDFIAGMHIEDKSTVVKPGYLLNLIEKIQGDPLPHILILDEINRIDVSRLFGELFSALEYREEKIKLPAGDLEISLPSNLYFIGTMNEIDFSLERIDFALRRRFLWRFKGFDRVILWNMIIQKNEKLKMNISEEDVETFINRCDRLNEAVSNMPELGNNYQIGHTFFAEVVDVFKSLKGIHSGRLYFLQQPVSILWEISIKPILEAFMGNLDVDSKNNEIEKLNKIFING